MKFDIAQTFSKDEEIDHWFLSGQGREEGGKRVDQVVWAYVVEVGSLCKSDELPSVVCGADQLLSVGPHNAPYHRPRIFLLPPIVHYET